MAGTAHLLGFLPALAPASARETAGYLGAFAAGTIAAMTLFAGVVGWAAPARSLRAYRWALGFASAACAGVGAVWLLLPRV